MSGNSIRFGDEIKKCSKKCGIYAWLSGARFVCIPNKILRSLELTQ